MQLSSKSGRIRTRYNLGYSGKFIMLRKLFPQQIDNSYSGSKLALWILGLILILRIAQSALVIFNGYSTAITADGIPLDTYAPASAQTIVAISALSAVARLLICLICILVLIRYRNATPLMYLLLIASYVGGQIILYFFPIATTTNKPAPLVNLIAFGLMIVGLGLSLWSRNTSSISAAQMNET